MPHHKVKKSKDKYTVLQPPDWPGGIPILSVRYEHGVPTQDVFPGDTYQPPEGTPPEDIQHLMDRGMIERQGGGS